MVYITFFVLYREFRKKKKKEINFRPHRTIWVNPMSNLSSYFGLIEKKLIKNDMKYFFFIFVADQSLFSGGQTNVGKIRC